MKKIKIIGFNSLSPFGGKEYAEKIIYRLTLLGVVKDWTTDFYTSFEVEFGSLSEQSILCNIENYIGKYEQHKNILQEIEGIDKPSFLEKSVIYLLKWIFNNIIYNRKQSLKTLSDWCCEYVDSESFKKRIDNYFVFSEVTFIFQAIGESPNDYKNWFKVFFYDEETTELLENGKHKTIQFFIPEIKDERLKKSKYVYLKDAISRFLESYQNNIGLNFISGLIRLALDEFEDMDGRMRIEDSLKNITLQFDADQQFEIMNQLSHLISFFEIHQKEALSLMLKKYFSENVYINFVDKLDLPYLLNDIYIQKLEKLKLLNHKLYEQLAKI